MIVRHGISTKFSCSSYESVTGEDCIVFSSLVYVLMHSLSFCFFSLIAIAKLGNMCLAAVQTYDTATESIEALNAAELKFQDIINSPSLDVACRKIDNLAEKNQLDSALVLMITKAWSAAKDSNMMKDEVYLYCTLYFNAFHFYLCSLKYI